MSLQRVLLHSLPWFRFKQKQRVESTNLPVFYGSERPLVGLPHHNNPAGPIVTVHGLPVSMQIGQRAGISGFPPAQRHLW